MTIPPGIKAIPQKVSDMVRELIPAWRHGLTQEERRLAVHLRGNIDLYESLRSIIRSRIAGRAAVPEPTDPLICKSMLARDRELQWLLLKLEYIYRSPVNSPAQDDGEPPAA